MTGRAALNGGARLRPELTDAMLTAALDQLEEFGYERLSMDQVARRAGVGKAALYRRWSGKLEMVVDALAGLRDPLPQKIELDSLEATVCALLNGVLDWLQTPRIVRVLPDLIAQAQRQPVLAAIMREQIGGPRRGLAEESLRPWTTADQAGQTTRELALDLLAAPIYWRLSQQLPVDEGYVDRLADLIVGLLRATRSGSGEPRGAEQPT